MKSSFKYDNVQIDINVDKDSKQKVYNISSHTKKELIEKAEQDIFGQKEVQGALRELSNM